MGICGSKTTSDAAGGSPEAAAHNSFPGNQVAKEPVAESLQKAAKAGSTAVLQLAKQPSFLQGRSLAAEGAVARANVEAVVAAVEALLRPLVDQAEQRLASDHDHAHALNTVATYSWATLKPADLQPLLCSSSGTGQPSADSNNCTAQVVRRLLAAATPVWDRLDSTPTSQTAAETPASHHQIGVPSLDRIVAMVAVAVFPSVVHTSQEVATAQWEEVSQLWKSLGLDSAATACLLSPASKAVLAGMQMAAQQSQRKITFKVHRATAFEDTYQQAAAQGLLSSSTGPCLLFPTFFEGLGQAEALESGEGHGPRKEYYGLIGRALCSTSDSVTPENALLSASGPQLFTYNQSAACYWFNTSLKCTVEHCGHYHCAGWLTGQVISNRAALGISLPALLFQKLLDGPKFKASLEALTAFDSTAAASLSKVASLDDAAFQTLLQVENAPPQLSREAYIEAGVQRLLVDSCTWQSGALAEGFWSAVSRPVLEAWRVTPTDLAQIVNGSSLSSDANFRVQDVFRVVLDEQLEGAAPQLLMALWQVLERWPVDMKRRFVRFVTACERVPLPGMEVLRIELPFVAYNEADHRRLLTMLPQAHTCANTLELPDYWNSLIKARGIADPFSLPADQLQDLQDELAEIVDARLSFAIMHCTSYSLDELGPHQEPPQPTFHAQQQPTGSSVATAARQHGNYLSDIHGPPNAASNVSYQLHAKPVVVAKPSQGHSGRSGSLPPLDKLAPIARAALANNESGSPLQPLQSNAPEWLLPLDKPALPVLAFAHASERVAVASATSAVAVQLPGAVSELDETSEDAVAAPIVTPPLSAKGRLPPIAAKPAWGEPSTVAGGWTGTPKAAWGAERLPAHPPLASLAAPFAAVKHASPPTSSAPDSEVKAVASVEVLSEHDGHEHPASDLATQMTSSALSSSPDPPSSPSVSNLSASPSVPLASSLHEAPHKPASSFGSPRSPIKHVEDTHLDSERLSDGFDSQSELSHAQLDSPDCLDHDLVMDHDDDDPHELDMEPSLDDRPQHHLRADLLADDADELPPMQLDIPEDSDEHLGLHAEDSIEAMAAELNV